MSPDRESLKEQIEGSLDELDDWQLELVARAARKLQAGTGYGNAPFILGFKRLAYADGRVTGELEIGEVHLNPLQVVHGMVLFGLIDNAMGQAVSNATGTSCIQADMKIQFLRPVTPPRATVEAALVQAGRRLAVAEGRLFDAGGKLAALAISTYVFTEDRRS